MKYVIATPVGRKVGMADELWMAEEIASQGWTRQIWRRNLTGEWKLITKPRSFNGTDKEAE